jgi:uncharacterized membrane protein required for colicin V production
MNVVDYVILGILGVSLLFGLYRGFVSSVLNTGGCLLSFGSVSGLALMRAEHVSLGWYIKHITPKVLLGWILGSLILWLEINLVNY